MKRRRKAEEMANDEREKKCAIDGLVSWKQAMFSASARKGSSGSSYSSFLGRSASHATNYCCSTLASHFTRMRQKGNCGLSNLSRYRSATAATQHPGLRSHAVFVDLAESGGVRRGTFARLIHFQSPESAKSTSTSLPSPSW